MSKPKLTAVEIICEIDLAGWPFMRLLVFDDNRSAWETIDHWHGLEGNSWDALAEALTSFEALASRLIASTGIEHELPFP
jgi:hypothetical protein